MQRVSSYLKMRVLGAIESAPGSTVVARIRHVSEQPFVDEDGRRFQFTWRTIQTWYSRYKKDGTTTVLPKPRSDKGKTRKMTPEEVLEAIEQVRGNFRGAHNVTAFYRACIEKGLLQRERIAPNTFRRVIKQHELLKPDAEVESKRRLAFAKAHANELWQADTMVGPYVTQGAGKVQAKLIAFLDDASRVVCHGEFFESDNTEERLIVPVVNRTLHTYHSTLRILCEAFQIETDGVDVRCERRLIEEARRLNAAGKMLAPVIDDAHLMDVAALRKIRLLFEDFPKNHCLVLIAQPELLSRLSLTVNEDIKSRVTYSVLLQKLAPDTLADFIKSELDKVALAHSTFTDDALSLIVRSAEGGLRRAKNLCLAALLDAVRDRTKTVDLKHVNRVLLQPHWRHYEAAFPEGMSGALEGRNIAKVAAAAAGGAL